MRDLEPTLFGYVWRYSRRDQVAICLVVLASLPFYFASLDLPRRIVNDAITGKAFEKGNSTTSFLDITVHWPAWLGGGATQVFSGFEVGRLELLLGLSALFLTLVLINGAFKFWINLQKGVLGERMLRRLRFQLFSLMLRFTPEAQGEVKASETATIIRDEVEPIGSFIGDAFVVPAFLGTQAATALTFILMQNVWLGVAAGAMVGVQMIVIPRLRREIIRLSRRRQLASRNLAGRIGEVLEGLDAVTANGAGRWEQAEIGGRLHGLYDLRLRIYRRKFAVKYLNNLLAQVTPFLFYAIGGLFALKGQLDIGQLVAVLAAYRDLPPPLKELIDWDQQRLDVEVKYETVAAHFASHRLRPPEPAAPAPPRLGSPLRVEGVTLHDPHDGRSVEIEGFTAALPARLALTSPGSALARQLALAIVGLQRPATGTIRIGTTDLAGLSAAAQARRIAYLGAQPVLFPGSLRDNLLYGLHWRPGGHAPAAGARHAEALRTGNPAETVDQDWIDYGALGLRDAADLDQRLLHLLGRLGMEDDLYRFGLGALSSVTHETEAGQRMIQARAHLREHFAEAGLEGLVIPFARGSYNAQASVAENLLFGVPDDPALLGPALARDTRLRIALLRADLYDDLAQMGVRIARTLTEIFRGLPPGHGLMRRFSLVDPEALPDLERRLAGIGPGDRPARADEEAFLALALPYVEPRQRLGLLTAALQARIVGARGFVQAAFEGRDGHGIEPYDPGRINPRSSILDNLLFGRIDTARMRGEAEIRAQVRAAVRSFGLEEGIRRRGLEFQVGNRGRLLDARQQAAVSLARALLRRPEILVVDGWSALRDSGLAAHAEALVAEMPDSSLIAVVGSAAEADDFPARVTVRPAGPSRPEPKRASAA